MHIPSPPPSNRRNISGNLSFVGLIRIHIQLCNSVFYLIISNQGDCFVAEFPVPPIFARIIDDFEGFSLELETEPDVVLLSIGGDDHEARRDFADSPPRQTNHVGYFERWEVPARGTILNDTLELVIFSLVGRKELEKAGQ